MSGKARKLRICYVLNTFDLGGAESVALNLARGHDREKFDVEIVGAMDPKQAKEPEMLRRCREAGVKAVSLGQPNLRSVSSLWRFFWYLKRGNFDIVLGHNRGSDYWAVKLGKWAGISNRYWTRHLVYQDMNPVHLKRYRSIAREVRGVIAVSKAVEKSCREVEQLAGARIQTIENGIDIDLFKPLPGGEASRVRAELNHPANHHMLLFVGRFCEQKAPEAFVDLMKALHEKGVLAVGYMCGHGPLAAELEKRVSVENGNVRILGLRSDIPALLGACDLFVSTSRNEGLPLNVMEAMSVGVPFAGPRIPQIGELVRFQPELDKCLYSPPPPTGPVGKEQIVDWAETIIQIIDNPAQMKFWGALGRSIIEENFSLQMMVSRYERVFLGDSGRSGDDK